MQCTMANATHPQPEHAQAGPSSRPLLKREPMKDEAADEVPGPRPSRNGGRTTRRPTMEEMEMHLSTVFIGFKPGDPTVQALPAELPPPLQPVPAGAQVIRVSEWSYDQLMAEAATTQTSDPFAALLPNPPGAPVSRLGHIAGQEELRLQVAAAALAAAAAAYAPPPPLYDPAPPDQAATIASSQAPLPTALYDDAAGASGSLLLPRIHNPIGGGSTPRSRSAGLFSPLSREQLVRVLHPLLSEPGTEVPWSVLGLATGPMANGKEISLRRLWDSVGQLGGGEAVTAGGQWSWVALQQGIDVSRVPHGSLLFKNFYAKYLQPYEVHLAAERGGWRGGREGAQGPGADAEVLDMTMEDEQAVVDMTVD